MADETKPEPKPIEAPMAAWVKGGTMTSAYAKELAARDYDAEQRRKLQDEQMRATRTGRLPGALQTRELAAGPPGVAKLSSLKLGGRNTHASVVLGIRHPKDNLIQDWIICELSAEPKEDGGQELVLIVACPKCERDRQMTIRQSNRMFYLDTRRQGEIWVNPTDPNEIVTLAGTITTHDWIKCPGCGWRFKVDDSVVRSDP